MNPTVDESRCPVIVGVGEVLDRPADELAGLEPLKLMAAAVRAAEADAGVPLLHAVERLAVVRQVSWSYADLAGQLKAELGLPAQAEGIVGEIGGETPVARLAEAAAAIAEGRLQLAVVCGAEAARTRAAASATKQALPWTPKPGKGEKVRAADFVSPLALKYGLVQPVQVYPLYEIAARGAWGQDAAAADAETGRLWSAMSDVAARNPMAWTPRHHSAADIVTAGPRNRPICHPYLKLMVAQPTVNQGAACIVTSVAQARAWGIDPSRWVYVGSAAHAHEADDFLVRDRFDRSAAMDTALTQTLKLNGLQAEALDALELYSCFPIVPRLARRTLGLPQRDDVTVAGGLTFFGAPLNNYMGHATAAMVRHLRQLRQARQSPAGQGVASHHGLLYGNGGYVSKHHALLLSDQAPDQPMRNEDVQAQAQAAMDMTPFAHDGWQGAATLETFALEFDRDSQPSHATVLARNPAGERIVARVAASDAATLQCLLASRVPVGHVGQTAQGDDGLLHWRA